MFDYLKDVENKLEDQAARVAGYRDRAATKTIDQEEEQTKLEEEKQKQKQKVEEEEDLDEEDEEDEEDEKKPLSDERIAELEEEYYAEQERLEQEKRLAEKQRREQERKRNQEIDEIWRKQTRQYELQSYILRRGLSNFVDGKATQETIDQIKYYDLVSFVRRRYAPSTLKRLGLGCLIQPDETKAKQTQKATSQHNQPESEQEKKSTQPTSTTQQTPAKKPAPGEIVFRHGNEVYVQPSFWPQLDAKPNKPKDPEQ